MLDALTKSLMVDANTAMLIDTCAVVTQAMLSDGGGGTYPDPAGPTLTVLTCRFTPVGSITNQAVQEMVMEHGSYLIEVPFTFAITVSTIIRYQGRDYDVTWSPPVDAWAFTRMAVLKER
jgi:hypothetical protein